MPVACLMLAALVAFAATRLRHVGLVAVAALVMVVDLHVHIFGAQKAYANDPAYAALREPGRLVELPIFRPDIDLGSTYLTYARQSALELHHGHTTSAAQACARAA